MNKKDFNKEESEKNLMSQFKDLMKSIDDFGASGKIHVPYYPPLVGNQGCPNCGYCQHCGRGNNNPNIFPNVYCGTNTGRYGSEGSQY